MMPTDNPGYLLHHLSFVLDRQSDNFLQERLGIGFSQLKILMALKWHEGVRQKQIADHLGQTEASISRQIKLMQDDGLLHSRISSQNRREHLTILSAKGIKIADEAMELLNAYHSPMFDRLSENQQRNLADILSIMHEHTCQSGKPGSCNHKWNN